MMFGGGKEEKEKEEKNEETHIGCSKANDIFFCVFWSIMRYFPIPSIYRQQTKYFSSKKLTSK